jgi:hypothetical protein
VERAQKPLAGKIDFLIDALGVNKQSPKSKSCKPRFRRNFRRKMDKLSEAARQSAQNLGLDGYDDGDASDSSEGAESFIIPPGGFTGSGREEKSRMHGRAVRQDLVSHHILGGLKFICPADPKNDDERKHVASGKEFAAPPYLNRLAGRRETLRNVAATKTFRRRKNKYEAQTLSTALDAIREGRLQDAVEVLGRRLSAVYYADSKGSWAVARKMESLLVSESVLVSTAMVQSALKQTKLANQCDSVAAAADAADGSGSD